MLEFSQLGIQQRLQQALQEYGMVQPTPIQEKAIPVLLEGKDIVAQAQTGTGKTLAFVLPMLEMINPNYSHIQALIITPTRELAVQITSEVKKLAARLEMVNVLAVYGGQDVERQMKKLEGAVHIVVATPGRLLDHLRRGTIDLSNVSTLVLDEADQMLHIGFLAEVEEILANLPSARQTALFSATISKDVRSLAIKYMQRPEDVRVESKRITVEDIQQIVVETTDRTKQLTLRKLLDQYNPFLAIIFCRTKRRASTLNAALQGYGYNVDELHGDLSQAKREKVMERFRQAKLQFLVATDVAARGLDVEGVSHVFNYDIPHDTESYIHRIGRTGRAGDKGVAITLVAPKDRGYLEEIEKEIHMSIPKEKREGAAPVAAEQSVSTKQDKQGTKDKGSKKRSSFPKQENKSGKNKPDKNKKKRGRR